MVTHGVTVLLSSVLRLDKIHSYLVLHMAPFCLKEGIKKPKSRIACN